MRNSIGTAAPTAHGCIAVDKFGCQILFLNAETGEIEAVLNGFPKTVHELLVRPERSRAYVPIFGDGIHGNNPNPGHQIVVIDVHARSRVADIDVSPLAAPHTMRVGPDGLIYVTCEDCGVVAIIDPDKSAVIDTIDAGSGNCHRLEISPDGTRIYTENEEDCSVSVIDLQVRKLLGQIKTPHALGGLAVSADGKTVIAVDDEAPALFLIDAELGEISETLPLEGLEEPAQIARYSPDFNVLALTSMAGDLALLIDAGFQSQTAIPVGRQPMDMAFRGNELFIACQGDGTIHVLDLERRQTSRKFMAGVGCESVGFF